MGLLALMMFENHRLKMLSMKIQGHAAHGDNVNHFYETNYFLDVNNVDNAVRYLKLLNRLSVGLRLVAL